MPYRDETDEIFGRLNDDGNVMLMHVEDGSDVCQLNENVYPVGSELSARHNHAEGIVLAPGDTEKLGIEIEIESE